MYKRGLIIVFIIGLLLRVVDLGNHPVGFTPDEASFGYDAYSLLKTGQDQWGNFMPLNLKSFGDYKLPVYTYLAMPFVALMDLSVTATRLPNAILGSLAILAVFYLTREIFDKRVALVAALLLAISPWHMALSRGAFEANLTSFFLPLALYFIYKKKFVWGASLIVINLFTYHTARLMTIPVLLMFLYLFDIYKIKSKQFWGVLVFGIVLTAFAMFNGGSGRLATSSIFSLSNNVYAERFAQMSAGEPSLVNKVFNNKVTYLSQKYISNYVTYLSPQFLFTEGAREHTYGMSTGKGVLFLFEMFSVITAIFLVFKKNLNRRLLFFVVWILLAPIPAALSLGPGHAANRAAFMMPAIQIISAFGIIAICDYLSKKLGRSLVYLGVFVIIFVSSLFSFESYWFGQYTKGAPAMFYGAEELVDYVSKHEDQYENIIVTKKLSEGHMFFAFFQKQDPKVFRNFSETWDFEQQGFAWVDQQPEYQLGKMVFRSIDWQRERTVENSLIIAQPNELPEDLNIVKTIYYPDNSIAYILIDNRTKAFAYEN